jgi:hypothetical protein
VKPRIGPSVSDICDADYWRGVRSRRLLFGFLSVGFIVINALKAHSAWKCAGDFERSISTIADPDMACRFQETLRGMRARAFYGVLAIPIFAAFAVWWMRSARRAGANGRERERVEIEPPSSACTPLRPLRAARNPRGARTLPGETDAIRFHCDCRSAPAGQRSDVCPKRYRCRGFDVAAQGRASGAGKLDRSATFDPLQTPVVRW